MVNQVPTSAPRRRLIGNRRAPVADLAMASVHPPPGVSGQGPKSWCCSAWSYGPPCPPLPNHEAACSRGAREGSRRARGQMISTGSRNEECLALEQLGSPVTSRSNATPESTSTRDSVSSTATKAEYAISTTTTPERALREPDPLLPAGQRMGPVRPDGGRKLGWHAGSRHRVAYGRDPCDPSRWRERAGLPSAPVDHDSLNLAYRATPGEVNRTDDLPLLTEHAADRLSSMTSFGLHRSWCSCRRLGQLIARRQARTRATVQTRD